MAHETANALGIDVAHFDGIVNWDTILKSGMSFGFAKATDGTGFVDPLFAGNWNMMGEVGITRGAYHFFRASQDATQQAHLFLKTVALVKTDMPPALDIEVPDGQTRATIIEGAKIWLRTIQEATGVTPIVYLSPFFAAEHLDNTFGDYPLWIAHYTQAAHPIVPDGWADYVFWQYASGESGQVHVPGGQGGLDVNRYNGTHADLINKFGL